MYYLVDQVSEADFEAVMEAVIDFAWDVGYLKVARVDNGALVDFGEALGNARKRLEGILSRHVQPASTKPPDGVWEVISTHASAED